MNTGKTLFVQLMDFLPWSTFDRIVLAHIVVSRAAGLIQQGSWKPHSSASTTSRTAR
jgi:hypothetical protein